MTAATEARQLLIPASLGAGSNRLFPERALLLGPVF